VVTLITLFLLAGIYLLPFPPQVVQVLTTVDYMVAIIFMLDFLRSLRLAQNKLRYFIRGGWIDMLGSLPGFPLLRLLRIFRLVRSWRHMRKSTSQQILSQAREKLAESILFIVFLAILVVITIGSSLVVMAESASPEANIQTGYEAVWWAFVTMATVGYGDYVPVTEQGRVVAVFVMLTGVAGAERPLARPLSPAGMRDQDSGPGSPDWLPSAGCWKTAGGSNRGKRPWKGASHFSFSLW
jgi:voltage-gated potassium channel